MTFAPEPVHIFNVASGLLFIALGALVLTVRPRRAANVALAVFAIGFGTGWAANYFNLMFESDSPIEGATQPFLIPAFGAATAGLVAVAWMFPHPLAPQERRSAAFAAAVGVTFLVLETWDQLRAGSPLGGPAGTVARAILNAGFWTALVLMALRFRTTGAYEPKARHALVLMSGALMIYPAIVRGLYLAAPIVDGSRSLGPALLTTLPLVLTCGLWLRNAATSDPPGASRARNVALLPLAVMLANVVVALYVSEDAAGTWTAGAARLLTVVVLAYAILEHQILGIDVKARWTISKTTIAAIFIAAFFVASETAQQFFGENLGSTYLGIAAAGALVFAIAPLQRLADRVAAKAIPLAGATGASSPDREDTFRFAVRRMLRDGSISRDEERWLAHLAADLGLDARRAYSLREEVERDLARAVR